MLMVIVRGGLGGGEGKSPIRDESLNNLSTIISCFVEESLINGTIYYVLEL